jgi:hypothetical protein
MTRMARMDLRERKAKHNQKQKASTQCDENKPCKNKVLLAGAWVVTNRVGVGLGVIRPGARPTDGEPGRVGAGAAGVSA